MNITFRTTPEKNDIKRVMEIVESTKFFYDHEVEIAAELVAERLSQGESTGYYSLQKLMVSRRLIPVMVRSACQKRVSIFTGSLLIMISAGKVSVKN